MENNVAANADVVEEANVAEAALPQKKQKKAPCLAAGGL